MIKQCFSSSCLVGVDLALPSHPPLLLGALMLHHPNMGLWVICAKAHIVCSHATHIRKDLFFSFTHMFVAVCVCAGRHIYHSRSNTLNRSLFFSYQTLTTPLIR